MITPKEARESYTLWLENDMNSIYNRIDCEIKNNYLLYTKSFLVDLACYFNGRKKKCLRRVLDNYKCQGWNIRRAFPYFLNRFVFTERKNDG